MIFHFGICNYEGCQNRYFEVDDNLTREEVIEKIHEAFRNYIKKELDKDEERIIGQKHYCTEKYNIERFSNDDGDFSECKELDEEFEKLGLKKIEIPNYFLWSNNDAYSSLKIEAKCREPENCLKKYCEKVDDFLMRRRD